VTEVYVFTDLDDTLLQTEAKCEPGAERVVAALDRSAAPLSFHDPAQVRLLDLLAGATLVPVTGRNLAALSRVLSPRFRSFKVTSHGAIVLDAGDRLLPSWAAVLDAEVPAWAGRLAALFGETSDWIAGHGLRARVRVIEDLGRPVYLSVKGEAPDLDAVASFVSARWDGGAVHRNGSNLAALPPYARKERAVAHLIERLAGPGRAPLFVGMGDSLTDLPFLKLCHFAVTPRGSQIQRETWR